MFHRWMRLLLIIDKVVQRYWQALRGAAVRVGLCQGFPSTTVLLLPLLLLPLHSDAVLFRLVQPLLSASASGSFCGPRQNTNMNTSTKLTLLTLLVLACLRVTSGAKRNFKCPSGCACTKETIICVGNTPIPRTVPSEFTSLWVIVYCLVIQFIVSNDKKNCSTDLRVDLKTLLQSWTAVCREELNCDYCYYYFCTGVWWMDPFLKLQRGCSHSCRLCSSCEFTLSTASPSDNSDGNSCCFYCILNKKVFEFPLDVF